jgi:hypothetical protein
MNKNPFLFAILLLMVTIGCNRARFERTINFNLAGSKDINLKSPIAADISITTADLINKISDLNATSGTFEKIEIETLQLKIKLLPNNTATGLNNLKIILTDISSTELIHEVKDRFPINQATVLGLNTYIVFKGVDKLKKSLQDVLAGKKLVFLTFKLNANLLPGEELKATVTYEIKGSCNAVTCETVAFE